MEESIKMPNLINFVEQDDFDVVSFVERLARQALGGEAPESGDDALLLKRTFEETIVQLAHEFSKREATIARREESCAEVEAKLHVSAQEILAQHQAVKHSYKKTQKQMNQIAARTSYLGDLLEAHDLPRTRLLEAESMVVQFEAIILDQPRPPPRYGSLRRRQKSSGLSEHAQNVLKLHLAASELLSSRYDAAKQRIAEEYSKVEADLLSELSNAQRRGDACHMREIVEVMSNFRGYAACVDQFIAIAQKKAFLHPDIFQDAMPIARKVSQVVKKVFPYPESVNGKFVDNLLRVRVVDHVTSQLYLPKEESAALAARQLHLVRMAQLYAKTVKLCNELYEEIPMDNVTRNAVREMPREIFKPYLRSYQALEYSCMRARLDALIQAYYQSVGHQRKSTSPSPLRDIRCGIQSKLTPKAATLINVAPSVKDFGGETFICEVLAVNTLQELREAFMRTSLVLREPERSGQALVLWQLFLSKFVRDHLLYGINLGMKTIPVSQDLSTEPKQHFLRSVYQTNAIFHLVENVFAEEVRPLLSTRRCTATNVTAPRTMTGVTVATTVVTVGTSAEQRAVHAKLEAQAALEEAIRVGLKRSIKAYVAWIRTLLDKQKQDEFLELRATRSLTAGRVVAFARRCLTAVDASLDGQNRLQVLSEFGRRFHQTLLVHIRRFRFSHNAGIGLLRDINEYRSAIVTRLDSSVMLKVFDTLYTLCSLLVVPAENLMGIISGSPSGALNDIRCSADKAGDTTQTGLLPAVDLQVAREFVELRDDCRSHKLIAVLFPASGTSASAEIAAVG